MPLAVFYTRKGRFFKEKDSGCMAIFSLTSLALFCVKKTVIFIAPGIA